MTKADLVADTNVISYIFRGAPLGDDYSHRMSGQSVGITLLSIAELRSGAVSSNWGDLRIARLDAFLSRFVLLGATADIANICGAIIGRCRQIGVAMEWPDAWAAATALWLDVPLATHDRDLEGIPGLRVITTHREWEVREEGVLVSGGGALWTADSDRLYDGARVN